MNRVGGSRGGSTHLRGEGSSQYKVERDGGISLSGNNVALSGNSMEQFYGTF